MFLFFLGIFDLLSDLAQEPRRDIFRDIFGIEGQHPDQPLGQLYKVDDPVAATLPPAFRSPPEFANASGTWDHGTGVGPLHQNCLELAVLLIREILFDEVSEKPGLDKAEHFSDYTAMPYRIKEPFAWNKRAGIWSAWQICIGGGGRCPPYGFWFAPWGVRRSSRKSIRAFLKSPVGLSTIF